VKTGCTVTRFASAQCGGSLSPFHIFIATVNHGLIRD
jgi:hypothetical protein